MQAEMLHGVALVTAGARRVGKTMALRLANIGFDIALHYRNSEDDALETKAEIQKLGRKCELFQADFDNTPQVETLISQVYSLMPELNVLVNNASQWNAGKYLESSVAELSSYLKIHVEAPFALTRDFAKTVTKGNVINILDCNIAKYKTDNFAYLLTKKTLHEFTLMAAAELAPSVRVNAIAPGAVLPPEDERNAKYTEKFGKNPLKRPGSPDYVADALEFLIRNDHISGQVIYVSAGKHLEHL